MRTPATPGWPRFITVSIPTVVRSIGLLCNLSRVEQAMKKAGPWCNRGRAFLSPLFRSERTGRLRAEDRNGLVDQACQCRPGPGLDTKGDQ